MNNNPKLTFYGGVGSTTGANIMLEFGNPTSPKLHGTRILVDCGLLQGPKSVEEKNFENFRFDPQEIDFLLITHAHMDHIGKVPKLVRDGFRGQIISTLETLELAKPMLEDALRVLQSKFPDKELFDKADIEKALSLWRGESYGKEVKLFDGCTLEMQDAGHILGSAILNVFCGGKMIAFTGDLGNSPSPLLPDTEVPKGADYLIMESVYGDRNHENKTERRNKLKQIILTGIKKEGAVIIPAFSIERTQVLLYEINNMIEDKEIPAVPVFVDSPLAEKVTNIYKKYKKDFKESVQNEIKSGDDIFDFPGLHIIKSAQDSKEIEKIPGAKIILAGSGMSEGGRVVNHELNYLSDPKATIVLAGYQSVGTLGRKLEEGAKEIELRIMNNELSKGKKIQKIKVRAKIEMIKGYSSHKDSEHLLEFVEAVSKKTSPPTPLLGEERGEEKSGLKRVFVIMGEPKASLFLCQRIRDYLDIPAIFPEEGMEYELI